MLKKSELTLGFVLLFLATPSLSGRAIAQEFSIVVNGQANAIFGGGSVHFELPSGTTRYVVDASGAAYWAPGRPFGHVLLERKTGPYSEIVAVPIPPGVSIEVGDSGPDQRVDIFFVDDLASDNSGSLHVDITPDVGPPLGFTVDAVVHCVDVQRAATIEIPTATCDVRATGSAWWAGPGHPFKVVTIMYDVPSTQTRSFVTTTINGPRQPLPEFLGGRPRLFFLDGGFLEDNGGDVLVTFDCDLPVPVRATTWGQVKASYSSP